MITQFASIMARVRPPWFDDAACRSPRAMKLVAAGKADFHPERGRSAGAARDICADCSVRTQCLDQAMAEPWMQGVRGGLTHGERRRLQARAS